MDAHKAIITNIFNNATLLEIPFFQRPYVWKEDLWERLLEDMEFVVKTKKPHFLGSVIFKDGRKPLPGELFADCKTVVDGQQRLTTFMIFMKVLCLKTGQTTLFDYQFKLDKAEINLRDRIALLESNTTLAINELKTSMESQIVGVKEKADEESKVAKTRFTVLAAGIMVIIVLQIIV